MHESLLGVRMTLYLGPTAFAAPAPAPIVENLSAVEVTLNSSGLDGFQLTFTLGRGPLPLVDYPLLANPLLRPFSRVVLQVWMGVVPEILIDGFITRHQVQPSNDPGGSTLTVSGEDVRVMMNLRELPQPYPGTTQHDRVSVVLARYMQYLGTPPAVATAPAPKATSPSEQIPVWRATDLKLVESLARDVGYVFYVTPTPAPMVNLAYWGPDRRAEFPQPALSINVGPNTNVDQLDFQHDALGPETVFGTVLDKRTGAPLPVATFARTRPPLAAMPTVLVQQPNVPGPRPGPTVRVMRCGSRPRSTPCATGTCCGRGDPWPCVAPACNSTVPTRSTR
jgi:hypothetical protein